MQETSRIVVGLDTSKLKISVALAEEGRQGEVRFLGDIDNTPDAMKRLVRKLSGKYLQLLFCYEAGRLATACIARSLLSDTIVLSSHLP